MPAYASHPARRQGSRRAVFRAGLCRIIEPSNLSQNKAHVNHAPSLFFSSFFSNIFGFGLYSLFLIFQRSTNWPMPFAASLFLTVALPCDHFTRLSKLSLYRPRTTIYATSPSAIARRIVRGEMPNNLAASES